jgi:hypothetical protein
MVLRRVAGYLLAVTPIGRFGEKMRGVPRGSLGTSTEETATGEWRGVRKGPRRAMSEAGSREVAGRVTKVARTRPVQGLLSSLRTSPDLVTGGWLGTPRDT